MPISDLARRAAKFAVDNSPTILTTIGVVGAVTTAYLAGKASFEAADIIRLKEASDEDRGVIQPDPRELLKQRVQLVWKIYIPAATMGCATIACIIGANHIGSRRAAGLAAAYSITEKTFDEYKAKVAEKFGERKEETVHDDILRDRMQKEPETYLDDVKLMGLDEGELCYDMFADRYFRHTVEGIRQAVNELNFAMNHHDYASLAEFYDNLGLDAPPFSEGVGWNSDRMLEVNIGAMERYGKPVITMRFKHDPLPDYGRFRG